MSLLLKCRQSGLFDSLCATFKNVNVFLSDVSVFFLLVSTLCLADLPDCSEVVDLGKVDFLCLHCAV